MRRTAGIIDVLDGDFSWLVDFASIIRLFACIFQANKSKVVQNLLEYIAPTILNEKHQSQSNILASFQKAT